MVENNNSTDMDYGSLITPINTLAPFEEFVEPLCAETSRKIEELQRKMQVLLKRQGIQTRSEARAIWPGFAPEYKKLLSDVVVVRNVVEEKEPLLNYESEDDANILSTSTDNEGFNRDFLPHFHNSVASLEEEVLWKINFSQGGKVKDTKIFFFGSVLFRLTFGHHDASSQYYLHLSVAEKQSVDIRVYCKYRIHDPTTEEVIMTQVAENNYTFRAEDPTTAGIDNFAGPELVKYLDGYKRLLISVVLLTELGPHGEMRGIQLNHDLDMSPYT